MMLLAPTAAAIAGAVALPTLAVLYLLKLRRRPVRISSTLLWRQAYEDLEANIPWRWVRPSWLVLIHLLLVALLVLAIGRPAIGGGGAPASRIVLIIDRSASMNAMDGDQGVTRLEEAKRRAGTIIDGAMSMGRNVEVAVISAAAEARGLTALTRDRRLVEGVVQSIEPSDQPLDLGGALELAGAMLGERDAAASEASVGGAVVVLVSDGSAGEGTFAAPPGASVQLERVGPSPESVSVESAPADASSPQVQDHDNVGIIALSARRDPENPAVLRVFLDVANASRRPRSVTVVLTLAGVERLRQAVVLPASPGTGVSTRATTLELSTRDAGVLTAALAVKDLLESDNSASMEIAAPTAPAILLVVPESAGGSHERLQDDGSIAPRWLLEDILSELRPSKLQTVTESQAPAMIEGLSGGFDLCVFDRVTPRTAPRIPSIVLGGGIPALGVESVKLSSSGERDFVLSWERSHPLLRDVTLDTAFSIGGKVLRTSEGPQSASVSRRTDIALGGGGPLIEYIEAGGLRHVVVAFDLEHSNWGLEVGFPIFLANAVDLLTLRPDSAATLAHRIADPFDVEVPQGVRDVSLDGPSPTRISSPPPPSGSSAPRTVSAGRVERAGTYRVLPEGVRPGVLCANVLDAGETGLRTSDSAAVRARGGPKGGGGAASAGMPREISHLVLAAVLVLLAVEWMLYARSARA